MDDRYWLPEQGGKQYPRKVAITRIQSDPSNAFGGGLGSLVGDEPERLGQESRVAVQPAARERIEGISYHRTFVPSRIGRNCQRSRTHSGCFKNLPESLERNSANLIHLPVQDTLQGTFLDGRPFLRDPNRDQ